MGGHRTFGYDTSYPRQIKNFSRSFGYSISWSILCFGKVLEGGQGGNFFQEVPSLAYYSSRQTSVHVLLEVNGGLGACAAVVAGVFHVDCRDLVDGIHPEVGAVSTAPAEGGDGKPVPLVGDDADAETPTLPRGHDLKGDPGGAHLADEFFGNKLCAVGQPAAAHQHLGKLDVIGEGGAKTRTAREPGDGEVLKDTTGAGGAVLADAHAVLFSAAVHDDEAGPLILRGGEGGVLHAQ